MRARHTQARLQYHAITSAALVNRTRMKVVKMKLTNFFSPSWPGLTPPSIFFERFLRSVMDARVKPAHDAGDDCKRYACPVAVLPSAACAAARRAIGTR